MGPGYGMPPYAASNLNLTAEQSNPLQTLRETYLNEVTPLQNQIFGKRAELRMLWAQQNPDQTAITAKQKEILELQQQLQEKSTKYQLDCRNALTSEQHEMKHSLEQFHLFEHTLDKIYSPTFQFA